MAEADPTTVSETGQNLRSRSSTNYVRWGGLAAMLGPLLVLVANGYLVWRDFGPGPESVIEAATSTPYLIFGGLRLLGGTLLVFGLIALYAYQVETAGRLGAIGFVISMIGTVLLTGSAWFQLFIVPAMAAEVPAFTEAARAAQVGQWTTIGLMIPILAQSLGWVIFGIASYRANFFPRRTTAVLIIGALLLFVPVQGIPVVFQVAVAYLGYLLFSERLDAPAAEPNTSPT